MEVLIENRLCGRFGCVPIRKGLLDKPCGATLAFVYFRKMWLDARLRRHQYELYYLFDVPFLIIIIFSSSETTELS